MPNQYNCMHLSFLLEMISASPEAVFQQSLHSFVPATDAASAIGGENADCGAKTVHHKVLKVIHIDCLLLLLIRLVVITMSVTYYKPSLLWNLITVLCHHTILLRLHEVGVNREGACIRVKVRQLVCVCVCARACVCMCMCERVRVCVSMGKLQSRRRLSAST